jgi:hypothetical protein
MDNTKEQLIHACSEGNLDIVKELIEQCHDHKTYMHIVKMFCHDY